ncbi:protein Frey 1 [Dendropsophus ebraccatus]|uniref:protein Frey 1 n=1 Tax=Dendropsophus ebraccatus TaxID=150705 RepID=UPI003831EDA0
MGGSHVPALMSLLLLLLELVTSRPALLRSRRDIPLDFEALAEMPEEHPGLVDDYGVLPKHPSFRHRVTQKKPKGLVMDGESKRDEPDIGELYYDDIL